VSEMISRTADAKPGQMTTTTREPARTPAAIVRSMVRDDLIEPAEAAALLNLAAAWLTAGRTTAAGLRTLAAIANDTDDAGDPAGATRRVHAIYTALTPGLGRSERDRQWANLRATVEQLGKLEDDQRCTDLDRAEHADYASLLRDLDAHSARVLDAASVWGGA
jgi:hypothetical protein